jgi:hypothetical protein
MLRNKKKITDKFLLLIPIMRYHFFHCGGSFYFLNSEHKTRSSKFKL